MPREAGSKRRSKRQGKEGEGGGQFSTWVQDMLPKSQIFGRHIFLVKVGAWTIVERTKEFEREEHFFFILKFELLL